MDSKGNDYFRVSSIRCFISINPDGKSTPVIVNNEKFGIFLKNNNGELVVSIENKKFDNVTEVETFIKNIFNALVDYNTSSFL